jgi:hypothetical protein
MTGGLTVPDLPATVVMIAYTALLVEFLWRYLTKRSTTREIDLVGWIPGCGGCCGGGRRKKATVAAQAGKTQESKESVENANGDDVEAASARPRKKRNVKVKVLLAACAFSTLLIFIR